MKYVHIYMCMCVYIYTHTHPYIYIYIYMLKLKTGLCPTRSHMVKKIILMTKKVKVGNLRKL